ncbi:MAG: hypothetical protein LBH20_07915 [Treponema sp.]|nr:hypothetical protein [Treponema sp.]
MTPEQRRINAEKSLALATALFPFEKWIPTETNIWVAKSRLVEKKREREKWKREIAQARILTTLGSVAYFLPERVIIGKNKTRCADLVLDGEIMEMKTVSGTRVTLGGEFRLAYKQGASLLSEKAGVKEHSVFIRLKTDLSRISVMSKIAGELKDRPDQGRFICYFEANGELHFWAYDELRSIIGKNNPAYDRPGVGR